VGFDSAQHHLAQYNVAWSRWDKDDPRMADFYARVRAMYEVAEASPGFVWRPTDDEDSRFLLTNLSVWASVEALRTFVYRAAHAGVLQDRARWFESPKEAHQVLWWVAAGHRPDWNEARERLAMLRATGPTTEAFTFAKLYSPGDSSSDSSISSAADA
jgi:hypothetical protein